jgi:hypothetical protein
MTACERRQRVRGARVSGKRVAEQIAKVGCRLNIRRCHAST